MKGHYKMLMGVKIQKVQYNLPKIKQKRAVHPKRHPSPGL